MHRHTASPHFSQHCKDWVSKSGSTWYIFEIHSSSLSIQPYFLMCSSLHNLVQRYSSGIKSVRILTVCFLINNTNVEHYDDNVYQQQDFFRLFTQTMMQIVNQLIHTWTFPEMDFLKAFFGKQWNVPWPGWFCIQTCTLVGSEICTNEL